MDKLKQVSQAITPQSSESTPMDKFFKLFSLNEGKIIGRFKYIKDKYDSIVEEGTTFNYIWCYLNDMKVTNFFTKKELDLLEGDMDGRKELQVIRYLNTIDYKDLKIELIYLILIHIPTPSSLMADNSTDLDEYDLIMCKLLIRLENLLAGILVAKLESKKNLFDETCINPPGVIPIKIGDDIDRSKSLKIE